MFKRTLTKGPVFSHEQDAVAANLEVPTHVTLASCFETQVLTVQTPEYKTGSEYRLYHLKNKDTGYFSHVLRAYQAPHRSAVDALTQEKGLIRQVLGEVYLEGNTSKHFFVMPNRSPSLRDYLQHNLMMGSIVNDANVRYLLVLNALFDLSNSLHDFHQKTGYVHMDLKDTNVVYRGSRCSMQLIDFGQSVQQGAVPTKRTESRDQSPVARVSFSDPEGARPVFSFGGAGRRASEVSAEKSMLNGEVSSKAEVSWDAHALGNVLLGRRQGTGWLPELLTDKNDSDTLNFSELFKIAGNLRKQANPTLAAINEEPEERFEESQERSELLSHGARSDGEVNVDEANILKKVSERVLGLLKQHMWAIESECLWRFSVAQVFSSSLYSSFHSVHERRLQMAYYAFLTGRTTRDYVASPAVSFFGLSSFMKAVRDVQRPELELRDQACSVMRALYHGVTALITLPFTATRNLLKLVFECVPAYLSALAWKQKEKEEGSWAVLCYAAWGFCKILQIISQQILSPLNAAKMWSSFVGDGWKGRVAGALSLAVSLAAIGAVFNIIMPFVAFFIAMHSPVWWLTQALSAAHIKVSFVQVFTTLCNKINVFHFLDKLIRWDFLSQAKDHAKVIGKHCADALGNSEVSDCIVEAALPVMATERLAIAAENKVLYGSFFGYSADGDTDQSLRLKSKALRGEENFNVLNEFQLTPRPKSAAAA